MKELTIDLKCPKCGKKSTQVSLSDIANEKEIKCIACGTTIKLSNPDGNAKKINNSFNKLNKTIKSLGGKYGK